MDARNPVRIQSHTSVVKVGVQRSDCQFPRNDLVVLLGIALHYIISRIN